MKALDLFCGAGGITKGLQRAGFHVTGVDINPQPRYCGDVFIQGDALEADLSGYDLVCASPPCQAYTLMQALNTRGAKREHPKLIEPVREKLRASGITYMIENVPGAPLIDPVILCGSMFGLRVRRHRLFECSFFALRPNCQHDDLPPVPVWGDGRPSRQDARRARRAIAVHGDHPQSPGESTYRVNRARTLKEGQWAMGIDWMDWKTLTQAIPPAYSLYLGRQVMQILQRDRTWLYEDLC